MYCIHIANYAQKKIQIYKKFLKIIIKYYKIVYIAVLFVKKFILEYKNNKKIRLKKIIKNIRKKQKQNFFLLRNC